MRIITVIIVVVGAILAAIGLIFLVAVLGIKMNAKPTIEPIDLSPMSGVGEDFYLEFNNFLTSEGFEFIGDYSVSASIGKAAKMRIFRNFDEGIEASLYYQEAKNVRKIMISFETTFKDGFTIMTSTNREPPLFILKNKKVYSLPDEDFKELLDFHRLKLQEESAKRTVALDKMHEPIVESISNSYGKELKEQLEYGILKFDAVNYTYSFTLYGAVRAIVKILIFSIKTRSSNKSMFDTQYRVKNKKKEWIKTFNIMGFVFLIMGLAAFAKSAENTAVVYFRIFCIFFGLIVVLVTDYFLRTKKFEDSWK